MTAEPRPGDHASRLSSDYGLETDLRSSSETPNDRLPDTNVDTLIDDLLWGEREKQDHAARLTARYGSGPMSGVRKFFGGEGDFSVNKVTGKLEYNQWTEIGRRVAGVAYKTGLFFTAAAAIGVLTGGVGPLFVPALVGSAGGRALAETWQFVSGKERGLRERLQQSQIAYYARAEQLARRITDLRALDSPAPANTLKLEAAKSSLNRENALDQAIRDLIDYIYNQERAIDELEHELEAHRHKWALISEGVALAGGLLGAGLEFLAGRPHDQQYNPKLLAVLGGLFGRFAWGGVAEAVAHDTAERFDTQHSARAHESYVNLKSTQTPLERLRQLARAERKHSPEVGQQWLNSDPSTGISTTLIINRLDDDGWAEVAFQGLDAQHMNHRYVPLEWIYKNFRLISPLRRDGFVTVPAQPLPAPPAEPEKEGALPGPIIFPIHPADAELYIPQPTLTLDNGVKNSSWEVRLLPPELVQCGQRFKLDVAGRAEYDAILRSWRELYDRYVSHPVLRNFLFVVIYRVVKIEDGTVTFSVDTSQAAYTLEAFERPHPTDTGDSGPDD